MAEQDERAAIEALIGVGALMSNLLFNLGQDENQTAHATMRDLQRDWDAKAQAYRAARRSTPAPAPIDATVKWDGTPLDLLRRLRQWDMLDACADGPYWKAEIDKALAIVPVPVPIEKIAQELACAEWCSALGIHDHGNEQSGWRETHDEALAILRRHFTDEKKDA